MSERLPKTKAPRTNETRWAATSLLATLVSMSDTGGIAWNYDHPDFSLEARDAWIGSVRTGGVLISARVLRRENDFFPNAEALRRLGPGWTTEQFVTAAENLCRRALAEANRRGELRPLLQQVQDLAQPVMNDDRFVEAVCEEERQGREVHYDAMDAAEAQAWIDWIKEWRKAHE